MDGLGIEVVATVVTAGIGAGFVTLSAAYGISRIATVALEGTSRQPEAAGDIRTSMIIPCALIEGISLFGQVICIVLATR